VIQFPIEPGQPGPKEIKQMTEDKKIAAKLVEQEIKQIAGDMGKLEVPADVLSFENLRGGALRALVGTLRRYERPQDCRALCS
jgi:hypothetical protein